jgi:serine/threonine protein kinase
MSAAEDAPFPHPDADAGGAADAAGAGSPAGRSPDDSNPGDHAAADKAEVERMVAVCIEALERGDADPATRACAMRPDLLPRVRRRLAQLAQRGLIKQPDVLPTAIGPYRIRRELGSGGMGSVYLADQLEPVQRQVAVKVVKLGMDTREVVARFQAERQALARMNHPHIAQVFDAGITAEGRPYFAMEYVGGRALTTFADQARLSTVQRVQLMATVCRAVQHAHDRGFIHRDLKPSNILVVAAAADVAPTPKIIDFGIAKATAPAAVDGPDAAALVTRADQVLGTPEYMSPEQMHSGGLDVDTRTDVYSLGVTLYELLCGELPFPAERLRRATHAELLRILLDELPTEPSKRLTRADDTVSAARGTERGPLARILAGELDWITLKALAKAREHRYPSALALAEDLERWLAHEPVVAAPPGRTYRLRKFLRRHLVAVGAAAAVLLALVVGLSISLYATLEARAAERREANARSDMAVFFGLARDAVGNLVDVADQQLAEVPQADAVRRRLLGDAIAFYGALQQRQADDPGLRQDLVAAKVRVGTLQRRLGQTDESLATLAAATAELDAILANGAPIAVTQLAISAHNSLGATFTALGRSAESRAALARALELVAAARADGAAALPELDATEARLAANLALEMDHDTPTALLLFERALACNERALPRQPNLERDHAHCSAQYAEALTRAGRVQDAATALGAAAARLQALPPAASVVVREAEATVHEKLATVLQRLERSAEAKAAQERAIALYHALAEEHPDVIAHADNEAGGWNSLAQMAVAGADLPAAGRYVARAIAIRERLQVTAAVPHRFTMRLCRSLLLQADVELQSWQQLHTDHDAAGKTLTRASILADVLHRDHADDVDVVLTYAAIHGALGAFATTQQRYDDAVHEHELARDGLRARLAAFETNPQLHSQLAMAANNLLQAHFLRQDIPAAVAAGEAGLPHLERGLALDARSSSLLDLVPSLVGRVAIARERNGDVAGAIALLEQMGNRQDWGADARESAGLLLSQLVGDDEALPERTRQLQWIAGLLQELVRARGDVTAAAQRPMQVSGSSKFGSRLRDLDLRLALGDTLAHLGRYDDQAACLVEAVTLSQAMPKLSADRRRNLTAQRAECALAQGQPQRAIDVLDEHLAAVGDRSGSNYLCAVLFAKARIELPESPSREALDGRIVQRLRLAIEQQEVAAAAAERATFAFLRGREDFAALRQL